MSTRNLPGGVKSSQRVRLKTSPPPRLVYRDSFTFYVHVTGYIQKHVLYWWFKGLVMVILTIRDFGFTRHLHNATVALRCDSNVLSFIWNKIKQNWIRLCSTDCMYRLCRHLAKTQICHTGVCIARIMTILHHHRRYSAPPPPRIMIILPSLGVKYK
jgi:hypothetical protein